MKTTWYKITRYPDWENPIKAVTVVKVTDKQLVIERERWGKMSIERVAKHSDWDQYFPTWEEARAAIIQRRESMVESKMRQLEAEQADLVRANTIPKHETSQPAT